MSDTGRHSNVDRNELSFINPNDSISVIDDNNPSSPTNRLQHNSSLGPRHNPQPTHDEPSIQDLLSALRDIQRFNEQTRYRSEEQIEETRRDIRSLKEETRHDIRSLSEEINQLKLNISGEKRRSRTSSPITNVNYSNITITEPQLEELLVEPEVENAQVIIQDEQGKQHTNQFSAPRVLIQTIPSDDDPEEESSQEAEDLQVYAGLEHELDMWLIQLLSLRIPILREEGVHRILFGSRAVVQELVIRLKFRVFDRVYQRCMLLRFKDQNSKYLGELFKSKQRKWYQIHQLHLACSQPDLVLLFQHLSHKTLWWR